MDLADQSRTRPHIRGRAHWLDWSVGCDQRSSAPAQPLPFEGDAWEMLAGIGAGFAVANWKKCIDQIREQAGQAELTWEDEARRQANAERLRIAREFHDVVAHSMVTINVQVAPPRRAGAG
jgi:signal transduction histidine kinase